MAWLESLGLAPLHNAPLWHDFFLWLGWQCTTLPAQDTRKLLFVVAPTDRLVPCFIAAGSILRKGVLKSPLATLMELPLGAQAYHRLSYLSHGLHKTCLVRGEITFNAARQRVFRVQARQNGNLLPVDLRDTCTSLSNSKRLFSALALPNIPFPEGLAIFIKALGGIANPAYLHAQAHEVIIVSENITQFSEDVGNEVITVREAVSEELRSIQLTALMNLKNDGTGVSQLKSTHSQLDDVLPHTLLILHGARAFFRFRQELFGLPNISIVILLSQCDFARCEVWEAYRDLRQGMWKEVWKDPLPTVGLPLPASTSVDAFVMRPSAEN